MFWLFTLYLFLTYWICLACWPWSTLLHGPKYYLDVLDISWLWQNIIKSCGYKSCPDILNLGWLSLCMCRSPFISYHQRNLQFFIFCAFLNSSDLPKTCMHAKKIVQPKVFSPKIWELLGLWGHIMDVSKILSCVLKFQKDTDS